MTDWIPNTPKASRPFDLSPEVAMADLGRSRRMHRVTFIAFTIMSVAFGAASYQAWRLDDELKTHIEAVEMIHRIPSEVTAGFSSYCASLSNGRMVCWRPE